MQTKRNNLPFFLTSVLVIMAVLPLKMFRKKHLKFLYQFYTLFRSILVLLTYIYRQFRGPSLLTRKLVFSVLTFSELCFDVSITMVLWRNSPVLLQLLKYLLHTSNVKLVVLWLVFFIIELWLGFGVFAVGWDTLVLFFNYFRAKAALIGLTIIIHLVRKKVMVFNEEIQKSCKEQLPDLLQLQKKIYAIIDCLNDLFGAVLFWAIITGICLLLDYFCLAISEQHYRQPSWHIIGFFLVVVYYEVSIH